MGDLVTGNDCVCVVDWDWGGRGSNGLGGRDILLLQVSRIASLQPPRRLKYSRFISQHQANTPYRVNRAPTGVKRSKARL